MQTQKRYQITGQEWEEVSTVGVPANQRGLIVLAKSASSLDGKDSVYSVNATASTPEGEAHMPKSKAVTKNQPDLSTATREELVAHIADLTKTLGEATDALEGQSDEVTPEAPVEESGVTKSFEQIIKGLPAEARDLFTAMQKTATQALTDASEAKAIAKRAEDVRLTAEYTDLAKSFTHLPKDDAEFGAVLRKAASTLTAEDFGLLTQVLTAANTALASGVRLGTEIGKSHAAPVTTDALSAMEAKAEEIRKSNPSMTKEQAFAEALFADPSLYTAYAKGK